jgi:peptide/nickel transport system permease protein
VARFLIRRVLQGLFVMWLMTVTVFLIFFVGPGPGSVARVLAGRQATAAQVAAVSHRLLLDRPFYVQYGHFIWLLLHGNLGYDYYHDQSVNTVLASALPITLSLVLGAAVLWLALGLASGIVSAVKTRSLWDRTFTTLALTFYSMPTFVLGLLLILGLYYELTTHHIGIFPAPGTWVPLTTNPLRWAQGLLLPWLTLALVSAATYTRLTRVQGDERTPAHLPAQPPLGANARRHTVWP